MTNSHCFTASVISEGNKTAVGGKQASLVCRYGLPEKVKQVLWKKIVNKAESREVASFAKQSDPVIEEEFVDHASLSPSLSDTQLTLWPVRVEDEACYTCEFHTYPDGTKSAISCLTIFGKSLKALVHSCSEILISWMVLIFVKLADDDIQGQYLIYLMLALFVVRMM